MASCSALLEQITWHFGQGERKMYDFEFPGLPFSLVLLGTAVVVEPFRIFQIAKACLTLVEL